MSGNANRPGNSGPGKRLERGVENAKAPLTPEQAQKKKERRIMVIMIVLAAVMVLIAAAVLLYNRWFKRPNLPPGPTQSGAPSISFPPGESGEVPLDIDAVQPKVSGSRKSKDIYTILVFGSDVISGCTDTMMLVTYDVTNQQAAVMSLPRDTIINSSARNVPSKKLNAVYNLYGRGERGVEALKNEVSELVGFVPDYYVKVDWALVGEMVDAIGGVWFDNPYHMEYADPKQGLWIYQEKGYRKLTGDDAMQVVRWRQNRDGAPVQGDGGDLSRLEVQHAFLKAVLKQTLQIQNVTKISQLAELFGKRVDSDLSVENLFWFGSQAIFGGLGVDDVDFFTMPVIGVEQGVYRYVAYPDQEELLKVINEKINPYKTKVTIRELDLMRVSADGNTLSSSTGVLADPSAAYRPASVNPNSNSNSNSSPSPRPSGPVNSRPPESHAPENSDPPQPSGPVETDPPEESVPVDPPPVVTDPPEPPEPPDPPNPPDPPQNPGDMTFIDPATE